ncbi:MAG: hypothetical protein ACRDZ0_05325 [Acidimicrobiales bacterium]
MSESGQRIISTDVLVRRAEGTPMSERSERIITTEPYSPRSGEVLIRRAEGTPMSTERR